MIQGLLGGAHDGLVDREVWGGGGAATYGGNNCCGFAFAAQFICKRLQCVHKTHTNVICNARALAPNANSSDKTG